MQKQVLVLFSIGKYHDEVLCDVVPMYVSYILLGKPRQFDRRANHDNFKNCFNFMKDKKLVTLVALTPKQVYEDQVRLKEECDSKKIEKEKESERKNDWNVNKEKREETKRKESFYAKKSEMRSVFYTNKPMFVVLYKEALLNNNKLDSTLLTDFSYFL